MRNVGLLCLNYILELRNKKFLGHGLGTATNAARIFGQTKLIEIFYPKMLYEIGVFGIIIFLAYVTNLIFLTGKSWQLLKDTKLINLGICMWVFILLIRVC